MNKKTVRILICVVAVLMLTMSFSMTAFAAGDVAVLHFAAAIGTFHKTVSFPRGHKQNAGA